MKRYAKMSGHAAAAAVAVVLSIATSGCSGLSSSYPEAVNEPCRINQTEAPAWACGYSVDEKLIGAVGSAPYNALGQEFSRNEAVEAARSNLAQKLRKDVKEKIDAYGRKSAIFGVTTADDVSIAISDQVVGIALEKSEQFRFWQDPDTRSIYVLVGVSQNNINKAIKTQIRTVCKTDDLLWQQMQSKLASKELDREFPTR